MGAVVIGYDGTDASKRALERAASLADGGVVTVVSVVAPLRGGGPRADGGEQARWLREARELLAERGIRSRAVEGYGDVAATIAGEAADERADVIVVGSSGKGLVERLVHGSVSSDLVHRAPCDVLVVR